MFRELQIFSPVLFSSFNLKKAFNAIQTERKIFCIYRLEIISLTDYLNGIWLVV